MREDKSANTAGSCGVDLNWYADSGATDHITGELNKLAMKDFYNSTDRIYTVSGSGMHIKHVG
jgi:xanthine dehydrogenase molybdopterin-binding subunit B